MNHYSFHRIITLIIAAALIVPLSVFAKIVDQPTAEKAARNFLYEKLSQKKSVAYNDVVVANVYVGQSNGVATYYAINFREGGFVLITAEDNLKPIIGYSPEGSFVYNPNAISFNDWMKWRGAEIVSNREKQTKATAEINSEWLRLTDDNFTVKPLAKAGKNVDPFIMSHWDQAKFFNSMCPIDPAGEQGRALTGCVATAMAQVLYYYRYPTTGNGVHTYNTSTNPSPFGHYGILSVNYGNSTYNFDGMVNSPTESNLDIAQLMYHAGVSVSMSYGAAQSGAQTPACAGALTSHWKYSGTTSYAQRSNYADTTWRKMIKTEIDARRPIMYSGANTSYGHCFVLDGYQSGTPTLFHFNWGWSGSYDGYFDIDNLNPGNDPNGPFALQQGMVKGIYPASGNGFPYQCTGQHVVTASQGTIEDGSSYGVNYQPNANCSWLIAPTDSVLKITLNFERFTTQSGTDVVKIYDGSDTLAPLLLTASGDQLPGGSVTSSSNRMLITFKTDGSVNEEGWLATFKPTYPQYCTASTLTDPFGEISDGSGKFNYKNSATCTWMIQPPNPDNKPMVLRWDSFETEAGKDVVRVYDAVSQNLLGTYSGTTLPPSVSSPSGQMYIEFQTDYVYNFQGWSAYYSLGYIGIDETGGFEKLMIYPNPVKNLLNISFGLASSNKLVVELISMTGQTVIAENYGNFSGDFSKTLDVSSLAKGVYNLRLTSDQGVSNHKIVVQ